MTVDAQYLSPVVRYDPLAQVVIIERRDPKTGEVNSQLPSEAAVKRDREGSGRPADAGVVPAANASPGDPPALPGAELPEDSQVGAVPLLAQPAISLVV